MRLRHVAPIFGLVLFGSGAGTAQQPGQLKTLDATELSFWKSIRNATTSNDGRWFAYVLAPNEGDGEVVVRLTSPGAKEWRFPIGEPAVPQFNPFAPPPRNAPLVISSDAKWAAFLTYPAAADATRLANISPISPPRPFPRLLLLPPFPRPL